MSDGTTARSVRVPDNLWDAALAAATANDETVSDVVRRALAVYVAAHSPNEAAVVGRHLLVGGFLHRS